MKKILTSVILPALLFGSIALAETTATSPTTANDNGIGQDISAANKAAEEKIRALQKELDAKIKALRDEYKAKIDAIRQSAKAKGDQIRAQKKKEDGMKIKKQTKTASTTPR